jgi:chitinase
MNRSQRSLLLVCMTLFLIGISTPKASAQAACYAAWNAATAYNGGQTASYSNVNYTANWWTQGNNPSTNNGVTGSGEPWTSNGACSSGATCSASPAAPSGLAASGTTSTGTTLSWTGVTAPSNCSISGYTILKNGAAVGTAAGTSFSVTGLTASTTYSFSVEATDSFGTSGASTPPVSVTTPAASCSAAPSAPTGLASSAITSSGVTLNWGAVTPPANCTISSYSVLKNGVSIGTASSTSFTVSGLSASTAYSFTVEATDANGTSGASTAVSVTTLSGGGSACAAAWSATTAYSQGMEASVSGVNYVANWWTQGNNPSSNSGPTGSGEPWTSVGACSSCATVPSVPTGLAASGTTSTTTALSWGAVTPPASCTISNYTVLQNGASVGTASSNSFSVAGLSPSTTYSFAVKANDAAGSSASSTPPVSVTTKAAPVCTAISSVPTGLAASDTSSTGTTLSWTAVTPPTNCTITSYTILRNGTSIGTATGTTFTVTGLTASTTYSFAVEATDGDGSSAASSPAVSVTTTNTPTNMFLGGWFEEWGTYYANSNVADLQNSGVVNSLTHVIYAFAKPVMNSSGSGATCQLADTYADYQKAVPLLTGAPALPTGLAGNFGGLWQLKQLHPNLKIWISIGGWNPPTYNQAFEAASSSAANQQAFVNSCISMFIQGEIASGLTVPNLFDGIEIDWEFPNASDTANFTALMTEFRTQLTALTSTTGTTYQLAADLSAGKSTPGAPVDSGNDGGYDTIDIAGLSAQLDYLNVDGYNYAGDFSSATNDASPLYDEPADPLYNTCATEGSNYIDCTVQYYLAHGATPSKYTMGFPLYGVGWTGGLTSANSGMYQTATGEIDGAGQMTTNGTIPVPLTSGTGVCSTGENQSSPAAGCDPLLTDGMATYGTITNLLSQNPGFAVSYDSTRCAARIFDPATSGTFADWALSYDDPTSVACKVSYIQAQGLGGGYVWALKDDTTSGTLTKAIAAGLGINP